VAPIWLVRAGKHGEFEDRFIKNKIINLTWEDLDTNLDDIDEWDDLKDFLAKCKPDDPSRSISNQAGQIWAFGKTMEPGNWVVLPVKSRSTLHFGKITGPYKFDDKAEAPFRHSRSVDWVKQDVPRTHFFQDLLNSFGAFMTICNIKKNNAEERIERMAAKGWKPEIEITPTGSNISEEIPSDENIDLVQYTKDEIRTVINSRFKNHDLTRLVNSILVAKGYTTYVSPPGPDRGVDILAATGTLGFGSPKICVQVKSGDSPVDAPTLSQLIGTMQNFKAENGLFVSWGGFKSSVNKEKADKFFKVRFWDQDNLIDEVLKNYDKLDQEIKSELPLKQIWVLASSSE